MFWFCELLELVTYKSTVWGVRVVPTENCYHWGSGLGARGTESRARRVGQRAHDEHTIHKHRGQSIVTVTEKPLPRVSQQQDVMSKMFPCEAVYLILAFSVLVSETSAVCSHLQLPFHPSCSGFHWNSLFTRTQRAVLNRKPAFRYQEAYGCHIAFLQQKNCKSRLPFASWLHISYPASLGRFPLCHQLLFFQYTWRLRLSSPH